GLQRWLEPPSTPGLKPRLQAKARSTASLLLLGWTNRPAGFRIQIPVEIVRRADQRQMRQRLRKISERRAAPADLFRKQSQVVRVSEHLLKQEASLLKPLRIPLAGARQRFHQPERAHAECALGALQTVRRLRNIITINHAVRYQTALVRPFIDG